MQIHALQYTRPQSLRLNIYYIKDQELGLQIFN